MLLLLACARRDWYPVDALPVTEADPERVARKGAWIAELDALDDSGRTLLGQNVGQLDVGLDAAFVEGPPERPAVLGLDLGELTWDPPLHDLIRLTVDQGEAGGMVTASASLANPMSRGSVRSRDVEGAGDLWDPRTEVGRRWETTLTRLGNDLQVLEDHDVIVLFRPFHEMNGDWFWWSELPVATFVDLWVRTRQVLEEERQLDNLVWVYGGVAETDGTEPILSRWPGDDQVDVVGMSAYVSNPDELGSLGLDTLRATGRPVALTEIGPEFWMRKPTVDGRDLTVIPSLGVSYALFWSSWGTVEMSLIDLPHRSALFAEPDLLGLEDWSAP